METSTNENPATPHAAEQSELTRVRPASSTELTARLMAAIDALVADPAADRTGSGGIAEDQLNQYHLAGRLFGLALATAEAADDERFAAALAPTALASGVRWAHTKPDELQQLVALIGAAVHDMIAPRVHVPVADTALGTFTRCVSLLMAAGELATLEVRADQDSELPRRADRRQELRERIERTAGRIAAQPGGGS